MALVEQYTGQRAYIGRSAGVVMERDRERTEDTGPSCGIGCMRDGPSLTVAAVRARAWRRGGARRLEPVIVDKGQC